MKDYPKERYGNWAGNPKGQAYQPERCAYEVWGDFHLSSQCSRKKGHGPDALFCKQHAKFMGEA